MVPRSYYKIVYLNVVMNMKHMYVKDVVQSFGQQRHNSLWEENSRNIMSTFIESTAEITRTESRLITQPIKLGKHSFFTMQPSKKGNPKKTASSAMSSSASFSTV